MEIEKKTLYWLAGLLEAKGPFLAPSPSSANTVIISVQMTDADIIARAATCFGTKYQIYRAKKVQHKDLYIAKLKGSRTIELMNLLRPLMGERRQAQIDKAMGAHIKTSLYLSMAKGKRTVEQGKEIKQRLANNEAPKSIHKDYNISLAAVVDIKLGRTWRDVEIDMPIQ